MIGAAILAPNRAEAAEEENYIAGNYVAGSPRPEYCSNNDAYRQARALAATMPGAFVMRGRGNSMLPLYRSGTLLVVQPVNYTELARGMSVVFEDEQRVITHILVAKAGDGWRTTGLNNRRHDFVPVNAGNLRGVVVAAFTPLDGAIVSMR